MGEELQKKHDGVDVPTPSDRVLKIQTLDGTKEIYMDIDSKLLASQSQFFMSLFSNGMKESNKNQIITLHTNNSSEEATIVELLNFMHGKDLSQETVTSYPPLLSLLMAADMYHVASCVDHCINTLLPKLPITLESANLIFDLPNTYLSSIITKFIVDQLYGDMNKLKEDVAALPLIVAELVFCGYGIRASEDEICDTVLTWARVNYPDVKRRRDFLKTNLKRFVRLSYMTHPRLNDLLVCEDLCPQFALQTIPMMAYFKKEKTLSLICEDSHGYPVEVFEYRNPDRGFVVFLTLSKEAIVKGRCGHFRRTKTFHFKGIPFYLEMRRFSWPCFGVQLCVTEESETMSRSVDGTVVFTIPWEQMVGNKSKQVKKYEEEKLVKGLHSGRPSIFNMTSLVTRESSFKIKSHSSKHDLLLRLRANIMIEQNMHL